MRRPDYNDIPEAFRRAMEGEGWSESNEGGGDDGGRVPRQPFPLGRRPWWRNRNTWLFGLIALVFLSFNWVITTYTDWLWFVSQGFQSIWLTQWLVKAAVFALFFALAVAVLLGSWHAARRRAARVTVPNYAGPSPLELPGLRWVTTLLGLFFAFTFATAARTQWQSFLLYLNRQPFNKADPIFGRDIGFYVFELPIYRFLQGWLMSLIVFVVLGAIGFYVLRFLPTLQNGRLSITEIPPSLRRTLAIAGTIFFLLWAVGYWFEAFDLLFSARGVVFGAGYTDINASLFALRVQLVAVVLLALSIAYNYVRLEWRPVAAAAALWLAATLLLGGIYPAILQRFFVEPTELSRERPYIEHNIAMTRQAFGLDKVEVRPFGSVDVLEEKDLVENDAALSNVRLWDYRPLQDTYAQLQELRPYYQFSSIDIDRYNINGQVRQVMLAARELDKNNLRNATWVNQKLEFTHGYGVVMNPVDRFTSQGRPEFFISDLPPRTTVDLNVERPEVYFGERTDDVVFVNSGLAEFNYPKDDENIYTRYSGTGGVPVGGTLRKLAFAIRFGESNILLSEYIDEKTLVLMHRQIQERVRVITPFLLLDRDPYLVVSNGRLIWMQDAYTISNDYPYSKPVQMGNVTLNYIRNSVKITIDAYDGNVNYYISDTADPIIQAYASAFPNLFQPLEALPESLQPHVRYPEDLFLIQTNQYLTYHMTDVQVFYNKEDLREIPQEIFVGEAQPMEPYYVLFRLPGEVKTEYLLIQPYTPSGKKNMAAWIAARNDPAHYGELIAYELPKQELVVGPFQIEGFIDQETEISQQFSLWDQRGSRVIRGNLIVIPLNNSFLYVEPIYLESDTSALPGLKRVIVSDGNRIVMRETLDQALASLLVGDAAVVKVVDDGGETAVPPTTDTGEATGEPAATPLASDVSVNELIQQANQQFEAAQAAQRAGDWSTYGAQIEALEETLRQLEQLTSE